MQTKEREGGAAWIDPDEPPPLTEEMLGHAEIFHGDVFVRRGRGRPKLATAKEQISVRIDRDVLAKLRESGPGWQSQIGRILRRALDLDGASAADQPEVACTHIAAARGGATRSRT